MFYQNIPFATEGTIIDVRSREEYNLGHVPGSVLVPWDMHLYMLDQLDDLPKPWIFVCEEGWRAGFVIFSLQMLGYNKLFNAGSWVDVYNEIQAKAA